MSTAVAEPMAKKTPKRGIDDRERKPMAVQIRGSEEWKNWLERAAKFHRSSVANLMDMAVAKFVREAGFTEPPPER